MTQTTTARTRRRNRALAHQCRSCRRLWALHLVEHPAGAVIVCRYCSAVRQRVPVVIGLPTEAPR